MIRKGNISNKLIELWKSDDFLLVASSEIIKEVEDVLKRQWLMDKYGYHAEQVDQLVKLISQKAILVEPVFSLELGHDPNDHKFVDCSVLGRVQNLGSEDNDFLTNTNLKKRLFEYGVEILNALDFYQKVFRLNNPETRSSE